MTHADHVCRYGRSLRILFRGLPPAGRYSILAELQAIPTDATDSEEKALQELELKPAKFAVVKAFLKIVNEIPTADQAAVREAACKEVREDLDDLIREIKREAGSTGEPQRNEAP